nr:zinc finger, CCHC-type [Tanacetum cinerariifolium]
MKVDGSIDKYKARLVIHCFSQKEGIDLFDTYAFDARISTIRLLLALAAIHDLFIHQIDVITAFLNGDLDEEIYMKQPEGFVMPGRESKLLSQLEYFRAIGCLMYAMISTRPDIAFVVGKLSSGYPSVIEGYFDASWINNMEDHSSTSAGNEVDWLTNLIYEIPLWPKTISTISIRCDSVVTLAKSYSQVYNGKSRHLGVTHSMIRALIMNGVISMEFVRTQLNLADHLTKGLARDLVRNAAIGMGLNTRPDIAFVVGKLSRYTSNPNALHYKALGYSDASCINNMEDHSSTSAGNEAEWLTNLIYEIPLWPKPISTISIRCDIVVTLAKAYSQVYNGKSRHLGVTHSMIRELIMNGVISVEFVRTQLNLADHLTKGLARDLIRKVAIAMGLKST